MTAGKSNLPTGSGRRETNRVGQMSTRDNAEFKWKKDRTVVGALEIPRQPTFDVHAASYAHKPVPTCEAQFETALRLWQQVDGRKSFIHACDNLTPVSSCCGLIYNPDLTVKAWVPQLNAGWAAKLNQNPALVEAGMTVSTFVWSWTNVMGEAETVILLIRFHMSKRDEKQVAARE